MTAQAGLLAQRDSVTPLLAVLLQLVANIAGDYYLVAVLKQGVAGAAWATVASQYLGVACLLLALQLTAKAGATHHAYECHMCDLQYVLMSSREITLIPHACNDCLLLLLRAPIKKYQTLKAGK